MPCLNTNLHMYPNIYYTTPIFFTSLLHYSIYFLSAHCVLLLLHVHCSPTCSMVLFGLMTTRLNEYYYYYYYYNYYEPEASVWVVCLVDCRS